MICNHLSTPIQPLFAFGTWPDDMPASRKIVSRNIVAQDCCVTSQERPALTTQAITRRNNRTLVYTLVHVTTPIHA